MSRLRRFRVPLERSQDYVCRSMAEAEGKGTMMRTAGRYTGRHVELDRRMLSNFGCCSYLGLDQHPALRSGAASALEAYGTQFSYSRAYLNCALYEELEWNLQQMTGRPVLVAPSTSLAHLAALPVLIHENDAVLIDQFAHGSLQMAAEILTDIPVRPVRHSRLDQLNQVVEELSHVHPAVWLLIDGLYSMLGDFAPFDGIARLLDAHPRLHVYIDDAHSTSWTGCDGRGAALSHFSCHERVVVALSLNKAFASAGGALALPNSEIKTRIRRCGGPMLFSGPIQPPMLGAAVASSRLQLAADHLTRQQALLARIDHTKAVAREQRLPIFSPDRTPIFFLECDSVDQATSRVRDLLSDGFYVSPSAFPAVPINRPGVRFTVTLHNSLDDIDAFLQAAGERWSEACIRPGHSRDRKGQQESDFS